MIIVTIDAIRTRDSSIAPLRPPGGDQKRMLPQSQFLKGTIVHRNALVEAKHDDHMACDVAAIAKLVAGLDMLQQLP